MSDKTKRATLTQEAIQILRNCSLSLSWKVRAAHLSDFSLRMKISGYSERYRETIIKSAISAWEKQIEKDNTGECPLYRPRTWEGERRRKKKEHKKTGWFRKLGGQTNDFALFCPASPGSRLAAKWKLELDQIRVSSGGLGSQPCVHNPVLYAPSHVHCSASPTHQQLRVGQRTLSATRVTKSKK